MFVDVAACAEPLHKGTLNPLHPGLEPETLSLSAGLENPIQILGKKTSKGHFLTHPCAEALAEGRLSLIDETKDLYPQTLKPPSPQAPNP